MVQDCDLLSVLKASWIVRLIASFVSFSAFNAKALFFSTWARSMCLSMTVPRADKTSSGFNSAPYSTAYPANLDSPHLQEIHIVALVWLNNGQNFTSFWTACSVVRQSKSLVRSWLQAVDIGFFIWYLFQHTIQSHFVLSVILQDDKPNPPDAGSCLLQVRVAAALAKNFDILLSPYRLYNNCTVFRSSSSFSSSCQGASFTAYPFE